MDPEKSNPARHFFYRDQCLCPDKHQKALTASNNCPPHRAHLPAVPPPATPDPRPPRCHGAPPGSAIQRQRTGTRRGQHRVQVELRHDHRLVERRAVAAGSDAAHRVRRSLTVVQDLRGLARVQAGALAGDKGEGRAAPPADSSASRSPLRSKKSSARAGLDHCSSRTRPRASRPIAGRCDRPSAPGESAGPSRTGARAPADG
jgi:hypothetical protein